MSQILREIVTTDEDDCGWITLKLACGHEFGPISQRRVPKKRKRCPACEYIAEHQCRHPEDHQVLINRLHLIPMDDRAAVMVNWVVQYWKARSLSRRGVDFLTALALSQEPTSYPLTKFLIEDVDDTEL